MNIVILDDYQDAVRKLACARLLEAYPAKVYTNTVKGISQLSVRLRDANVLVLIDERTVMPRGLLEKLPKLKMIAQVGASLRHIDLDTCAQRGIVVAPGISAPTATAELTWALIMTAMRRLPQYISHLKHGAWQQAGLKASAMPVNFGVGMQLKGKTLGLWGYSPVAELLSSYAQAFGMSVLVWDEPAALAQAQAAGAKAAESREALFEQSHILSLNHLAQSSASYRVTLDNLSLMQPTALLVNTTSAELVAADVLLAALNRGRPGMAAIDVFDSEPILQGHALLRLENCICTPHIGSVEQNSYEQMFQHAFTQVVGFIENSQQA